MRDPFASRSPESGRTAPIHIRGHAALLSSDPVADAQATASRIESEVAKQLIGQADLVRQVIIALLAGGHCLVEGTPGLGKTLLVRTLGQVLGVHFSRIQFTPDLMPTDIIGTNVYGRSEHGIRSLRFEAGPIFAGLVLRTRFIARRLKRSQRY